MILLVAAAWLGLTLTEKRAERHGISKENINNIIFYGLLAFVIGGRLSFILQNTIAFIKSPLGIISVNPDMFDPAGGTAVAFLVALIYGQRSGLLFWDTLDALTPFFAILSIGMGLGHLAAGKAFGKETDLAWGINLWNATRHPTQLYETFASLLIFILLWFKRHDPRPGILFLTFAALTAGSQLFIQAFRGDSILILNGIKQEQVVALAALTGIFILLEYRIKEKS